MKTNNLIVTIQLVQFLLLAIILINCTIVLKIQFYFMQNNSGMAKVVKTFTAYVFALSVYLS